MEGYNLLRVLKEGQFSDTYLYEKKHNNEKVVVKKFKCYRPEVKEPKLSTLRLFRHPNVIAYLDSFVKDNAHFVIMEYARRGTLQDLIDHQRPNKLPTNEIMKYFAQIVSATARLHSCIIVHLDLKPANIFLTGLAADIVKIGNFPLKNNGAPRPQSLQYMAPEVCEGKEHTSESDIWSLGCILFELTMLNKLFEGTTDEIVKQICENKVKAIDRQFYGIEMQTLLNSILKANPSDRPTALSLLQNRLIACLNIYNMVNLGIPPSFSVFTK